MPRPVRFRRLLAGVLIVGCVSAGGIWGVLWWQERPLTRAEAHLDQGEAERSLALANGFLESHPQHGRALALKARSLVKLGRYSEAIRLFGRIGAANSQDLHAWAQALLHQQQWSAALPLLERLLELDPDNPDVLHEVTACRERLGYYEQALETAEWFAAIPGHEGRGWLLIAVLHRDLGNRRLSAEAFERVLKHKPDARDLQVSPDEFFREYGSALLNDGRPDEALPMLKRSVELSPAPAVLLLVGQAYSQLGNMEEALRAWKQVLAQDPSNPVAREALANEALRRREARQALEWLKPLESQKDLTSSTAYLFQRAYSHLGEEAAAQSWKRRTDELRESGRLRGAIKQKLLESPESFWARALRAYEFAEQGNWSQAAVLVAPLARQAPRQPFIQDLARAIETRGPLPSLEQLSVKQF